MKTSIALLVAALCGAPSALAAEATTDHPGESLPIEAKHPAWVVQVTPYIWATGLKGRVSPFRQGPTVHVRQSFSDVLSDLDFAGFANVWARHDRLVLSGDLMYVDTTGRGSTGALPAFRLPGLGVQIPAGAEVGAKIRTRQFMSTVQGGYRLVDRPGFTLDALGGARFWHISNKATLTASVPSIGASRTRHGESFHWVDPLIGMRTFLRLTNELSIQAQADIGGFGAGSELTWSALATINYSFSDRLSASAGYKVLKVDYDHGGNVYNTRLSGPVLGMTYRF